ncbi:hypothetical protein N657DRAFT_574807 [Parathielavia appendiculata]|uniref:EKC/KEOPS complex subunit GON7 n=1 Tax=Parathielavia appendiculata TaxID=2587402 RepID=A0AAN6TXG6_9PEZI|nr:hypothetical protein N657DRAFT_574807 [Parathielavia appendiculata]
MPSQTPTLFVTYTSATNAAFGVSLPLTAPADSKAQYLSKLRAHVASVQQRINRELTARMEEDKARESGASAANGVSKLVDDEKEEENYGEEAQEEED